MRLVLALILFVAACGGKSPAPATADPVPAADPAPAPSDVAGVPEGGYPPLECDQYCADGCSEVEEYELCRQDCGCSATPEE